MGIAITVKSIAKPKIISIDKSSTAKSAAESMMANNIGSIVVSDAGSLVGIVTERDLIRKVVAAGKDARMMRLGDIMSSPLVTIDAGKGLGEATSLMVERKIRRLLVTENGKVVGIFTQRDLQQKVMDVFRSMAEAQTTI